jgi:hypothetical protein
MLAQVPARGFSIQLAGMTRVIHPPPEPARCATGKSPEEAAKELMRSILNRIGYSMTREAALECLSHYLGWDVRGRDSSRTGEPWSA